MKLTSFSVPLLGALALLFANACVIKGDDVNDDGETGETGDGDGDPGDGDGDNSEQGGDGDGDGAPGDGDGDPTGGEPDPAIVEACAAACGVFEACEGGFPDCNDACVGAHLDYGDDVECVELELALTQCLGGLSCEELTQFIDEEPTPYPCQEELEASCNGAGGECLVSVGEGENPGECGIYEQCEGQPEYGVECDGQTCTCFIDSVEVGGCADAVAICSDLSTAYDSCCG